MGTLIRAPKNAEYAELKARTHYSFLRGASHPAEMVKRASELGLRAMGIADRHGVYGIPKAFEAEQECLKQGSQTRLIVGAELEFMGGARVTALATQRAGYGLLCRLLTAAHADRPKGEAALEHAQFWSLIAQYPQAARELLWMPEWDTTPEIAASWDWGRWRDEFGGAGRDQLSLPVVRVRDGRDAERGARAQEIARRYGIPIVAVTDAAMHVRERKRLHDCLIAIRELKPLSELGYALESNAEHCLKGAAEMVELFADQPQAIARGLEWAERCTFSPSELRYRYPSEWIPVGESAIGYLRKLTEAGARGRYPGGVPGGVRKQLEHEFVLIEQMGFADYFLTIWEIVEFARSRDIFCQGRGSAANSIVCYCLGITAIDPVRMDLLFERFISAERGEPPDIDVDFEHERREEVIQHIYSKYGRDRAAMVAAVITYRSRSIVRDLSKAAGRSPEQIQEQEPWHSIGEELYGFPRHLSIHSGGFTLSADPMIETVPVEPARMEGRTVVQWDKDDLAVIGLLKVDVLALGMLTALHRACDSANHARAELGQPPLTLATIPADDAPTYHMIQQADTVGVFQIESRAQMNMLRRLRPQTFYDLVIQVAIVRPGPIVGKMVHPYLLRRRGLESSASPDPRLEPILGRTLGVPLFQEQVMKMAVVMAGFTAGESDQLRRAIGAWRSSGSIEKLGRKLQQGLLAQGLPQEFVDRIFLQIQGFAEYGFPESHAASFALLAYASSYLKCHYPAEFLCALLNSQPMGFYSNATLISDAQRAGVQVLGLDFDHSAWDTRMVQGAGAGGKWAVRIGFHTVFGLRRTDVELLTQERRARGEFTGLDDLLGRVHLPLRVLSALALAGVFAKWGLQPRQALWRVLAARVQTQGDLFSQAGVVALGFEAQREWKGLSPFQAVQAQYQAYGHSAVEHPMAALRRDGKVKSARGSMSGGTLLDARGVRAARPGSRIRLAGLVICRQRPHTGKGTVFATLEDEFGFMDLIIHEAVYERLREIVVTQPLLVVSGRIQRDGTAVNVIVERAEPLLKEAAELRARSHDFH